MDKHPAHRKRRTREHVIADLSVNYVERAALRVGYAVQRIDKDYGLDLEVSTFDALGQAEPGLFYIQLKATDHINRHRRGNVISLPLDLRDVDFWMSQIHPVILIFYDAQQETAFWVDVQKYVQSNWRGSSIRLQSFRSIRIPMRNRVNEAAMMKFAEQKNMMYQERMNWRPDGP